MRAVLLEQSPGRSHCIIYVDIDRLHVLNENLGMHVGDEVIVRVAEVIRRSLAPRMVAARISGRPLRGVPAPRPRRSAAAAGRRGPARRSVAARLRRGSQAVEVSASFGVAQVAEGEHPLAHALAAAEIACKAAKDRGRDRVEIYEDADQSIVRRYTDVTLVGTLRRALAEDRFRLEAQAIVPLNGAAPGPKFELLLRMTDESGESVSPDRFFSAAERYQLAPAIDRWVVRRVLAHARAHAAELAARRACFAVNISGQSLGDPDFCAFLEKALRESGLPPALLSFELTETAAVANIVRAEALMRRLRESRLRRRAGRLRSRPELARLPEGAAGHLPQDRRQPGARRRGRRALAGDAERHRAPGRGDGPQDGGRMRRERGDPLDHPQSRRRVRAGFRDRPARSAGSGDRRSCAALLSEPVRSVEAPVSKAFHTLAAVAAGALLGAGLMLVRGVSAERESPPPPGPAVAAAPSLLEEVSERVRRDYVVGVAPGQTSTGPPWTASSRASTRTPSFSTRPSTRRCRSARPGITPAWASRSPSGTGASWS